MDKFGENMSYFMTERMEESIRQLRRDCSKYDELRRTHADESRYMDEIINGLPNKEQNFTKEYCDDESRIISMERDQIYLQGYQDCIRLLAYVGILEVRL